MVRPFFLNKRKISVKSPPYIIAELSGNHGGSLDRALKAIQAAKDAGADALKIQTYTPDTMTLNSDSSDFQINRGLWKGRTLYDLYDEAHTPYEWHEKMFRFARNIGITIFSTPFDETAVDLLESLNAPAYKIASFELVDLQLIRYVASKGKPMILSTGMSDANEIGDALETAKEAGCQDLALLHCISGYPTPFEEANLSLITELQKVFKVQVGLSDHTTGINASLIGTALGATIIEKHFTLSRSKGGVDSKFSLEPEEMKELIINCRNTKRAMGTGEFTRSNLELENRIFRRSLYFVEDIKSGEIIKNHHVRRIRPGYGLAPRFLSKIIGKRLKKDVFKGERVTAEVVGLSIDQSKQST